jgi:hypothetical protein
MADIAASNVTHLVVKQRTLADSRKLNLVRLSFGNGALTYPAGGIPLSKGKMGLPVIVESMIIVDKGTSGYNFMYDQSAEKLVMIQAPAQTHTHDIKVIASITADATVGLNGATLGKNTATNATILGANSTAAGGVVAATLAAAAGTEPSAIAIAAQVIEVEVIGY